MDLAPASLSITDPPPAAPKQAATARVRRWCVAHAPELALLAFGVLLRISLAWSYDVSQGFDYPTHHQYIRYLVEHARLPPYDLNVATYHPPLFYVLGALIEHAGFSPQVVGLISISASCAQLVLLWVGLALYLPESRLARLLALALAAVVPASVSVAGMVSGEALSDALCTGALVLLPQVLRRQGRSAIRYAAAAGVCLGLALLTKVSGMVVLFAFLGGVAITIGRNPSPKVPLRSLKPVAVVVLLAVLVAGGHYARHRILYGRVFMTGYDQWNAVDLTQRIPYWRRRPLRFVVGWDNEIFNRPYYPTASVPNARFWTMLVATTFSDYYNVVFVPRPPPGVPAKIVNYRPVRASAFLPSRLSVMGGTALALAAVLAWLAAARALWRRRDHARAVPLLVGLLAMLGQLHFATRFPYDPFGPIKGAYLQFAAPVYCALAGLAIATLWKSRRGPARLLALAGVAAIALVAVYTVYARIAVPLASPRL